jgi:1-aminocyclopropane-1-carboxylate deaminase/D-cysteine desulfhydrase-like pyridoxal-dependent ACC family enzyme
MAKAVRATRDYQVPIGDISSIEDLFTAHTPFETHRIGERPVDVKRDDLYCNPMIAPLSKMRGVNRVMHRLVDDGVKTVGVFDFKVSKAGVGIAAMAKLLGLDCIACYQHYKAYDKGGLPEQQRRCEAWGAQLYPIPASRININYAIAKRHVTRLDGYMFPKGIILEETIDSMVTEIAKDADRLSHYDHIVISVGSGTIVTGLIRGLTTVGLAPHIHGVTCTTSTGHCKRLHQFLDAASEDAPLRRWLSLVPSDIEYYQPATDDCPFPAHPNYDRKAWRWLTQNHQQLEGNVLFWNIGA